MVPILFAAASAIAGETTRPACALFRGCGLAAPTIACTEQQSRPVDGVVYDAQRCSEPRDLLAHGVDPAAGIGAFVYPFLGGRYRVVYEVAGEAAISEARFDYLALNLPLASRLASRFSKTKYVMRYLDPDQRRFHAERGGKLTGEAELLFHDGPAKRRAYYGWGSSRFGFWNLRGSAYVDVRIRPIVASGQTSRIAYEIRIRTAPVNAMVNAIMRMGLFRRYVVGQIEDTLKDLVGAAAALSTQGTAALLVDPGFTSEEREKIRTFAGLP